MAQSVRNAIIALTTASQQIGETIMRPAKRTQFIVTNTDASATVTLFKGYGDAVANRGIPLSAGASYIESMDSGFQCWQGPISCLSTGSTNISYVEVIDNGQ